MAVVGEAKVRIVADVSTLKRSLEDQLRNLQNIGKSVGKDLSDQIGDSFAENFERRVGDAADKSGKTFGDAFGSSAAQAVGDNLVNKVDWDRVGRESAAAYQRSFASNLAMGDAIDSAFRGSTANAAAAGTRDGLAYRAAMEAAAGNGPGGGGPLPPPPPGGGALPPPPPGGGGGGGARVQGRNAGIQWSEGFRDQIRRTLDAGTPAPFEGLINGIIQNFFQLQVVQAAIYGVISAVMELVNSLVALAGYVGAAIPALLKYGSVLGALFQGMIVGKAVFAGVAQAIKAQENVAKAAGKANKDLEERMLRIARASLNLKRSLLAYGRAQEDANEKVTDAMESYDDALKNEVKAQQRLDDARKQAQERLQDLALDLEDASLSEERAVLNLKKAEKALAEARAGGNVNAIYEADLAYREQELSLRRLKEGNEDLQQEADKAFSEGVDGNEAVIDAQEALSDAIESTSDAMRALVRAIEDAPLDMQDASLKLQEAIHGLKKAMEDDSMKNALDALKDAMDELSPAAQRFVRYWVSTVQPILKALKFAGQEAFFPEFQKAIEKFVASNRFRQALETMVVDTATVLGQISNMFADELLSDKSLGSLESIFAGNVTILRDLGTAASNLVQPFLQIGEALLPIATQLTAGWVESTEQFKTFIDEASASGELADFFEEANRKLTMLWEMVKAFATPLKEVFTAAMPAAETLITGITNMATAWGQTFDAQKRADMEAKFQASAENALLLLDVLGDVAGIMFNMAGSSGMKEILEALERNLPIFAETAAAMWEQLAPAIADIIDGIGGMATAMDSFKAIEGFFTIVGGAMKIIGETMEFLFTGMGPFSTALGKVVGVLTYVWGFYLAGKLIFRVLGNIVTRIGGGATKLMGWKVAWAKWQDAATSSIRKVKDPLVRLVDTFKAASFGRKAGSAAEKSTLESLAQSRGGMENLTQADRDFARRAGQAERERARNQDLEDRDARRQKKNRESAEKSASRRAGAETSRDERKNRKMATMYGEDFALGVEEGMEKKFQVVYDAADKFATKLLEILRTEWGISSPAQKTIDLAVELGNGVVKGIESSTDKVVNAARKLGDAVTEAVEEGFDGTEAVKEGVQEMESELDRQAAAGVGDNGERLGEAVGDGVDRGMDGVEKGKDSAEELERGLMSGTRDADRGGRALGEAESNAYEQASNGVADGQDSAREKAQGIRTGTATSVVPAAMDQARKESAAYDLAARGVQDGMDTSRERGQGLRMGTAAFVVPAAVAQASQESVAYDLATRGQVQGGRTGGRFGRLRAFGRRAGGKMAVAGTAGMALATGDVVGGMMTLGGGLGGETPADIGKKAGKEATESAAKQAGKKGLGGALAKLGAKFAVKQAIGSAVPVIGNIIMALWSVVDVIMLVAAFWPEISEGFKKAWDAIKNFWSETVVPWWDGVTGWLGDAWSGFTGSISESWSSFTGRFKEGWDYFTNEIKNSVNSVREGWNNFTSSVSQGWNNFTSSVRDGWNNLWSNAKAAFTNNFINPIKGGWNSLRDGWNNLTGGIRRAWDDMWRGARDWYERNMPDWMKKLISAGRSAYGVARDFFTGGGGGEGRAAPAPGGGGPAPAGGGVQRFARGGLVRGGYRGTDTVRALVTPGEYVLTANMARAIGIGRLEAMRRKGRGGFGGLGLSDIPTEQTDWTEKELQRILEYFKRNARYAKLKLNIAENEQLFKDYVKGAIDTEYEAKKKGYEAAVAQKELLQQQQEMARFGLPQVPGTDTLVNLLAPSWIPSQLDDSYRRNPNQLDSLGRLLIRSGADALTAQQIANQVQLTVAFENKIMNAYLAELAKRAREAAEAAANSALSNTDSVGSYSPPPAQTNPSVGPSASSTYVQTGYRAGLKVGNTTLSGLYDPNGLRWYRSGKPAGHIAKATGRRWVWPLSKDYPAKTFSGHRPPWGVDISSPKGIPTIAIQDGVVVGYGNKGNKSYGQYIFLKHHDGTRSVYAHLSYRSPKIRLGSKVLSGAMMGLTGYSGGVRPPGAGGSHLHFELWKPGGSNNRYSTRNNMSGRGVFFGVRGMATGGVVPATPGGLPAILAEGGRAERVTPLDSQGRSATEVELLEMMQRYFEDGGNGNWSVVNHIYPSQGMDERALAQKVSREIGYLKRRRS